MKEPNNLRALGEDNLTRLMLKYSIPCILSLLISSLYNIVDQIFIGNSELSTLGNAATGVVFPVFIIAQAFAWCLGDGCAAYLNICQGRKDDENAHRAIGSSITLSFLSGILMIALILPFKEPILTLFGASENTMGYAAEYLNVILIGLPAYILANMMNSTIRADGSPTFAMATILTGAIVNLILDPIFIFVLKMGMTGAAIATVAGQLASFLLSAFYLIKPKTFLLTKKSLAVDPHATLEVLKLGFSTFITQIAIVLVAITCNIQLAKYGALSKYGADIPIAVNSILSKVFTVIINIVVGIVLGCQPIISYNMGAKKYRRVRKLYQKTVVCTLAVGLIFTLFLEFFPAFVIGLFGEPSNIPNPADYWEFGVKATRIFLALTAICCLVKTDSIFFQAVGKPIHAMIASTVRDVALFVPLIFLLPNLSLGIDGILYAAPLADLLSVAVALVLSVSFIRSLKKSEKAANLLEKEQ